MHGCHFTMQTHTHTHTHTHDHNMQRRSVGAPIARDFAIFNAAKKFPVVCLILWPRKKNNNNDIKTLICFFLRQNRSCATVALTNILTPALQALSSSNQKRTNNSHKNKKINFQQAEQGVTRRTIATNQSSLTSRLRQTHISRRSTCRGHYDRSQVWRHRGNSQ